MKLSLSPFTCQRDGGFREGEISSWLLGPERGGKDRLSDYMLESRESAAVSSGAQNDARLAIDAQHRFLVESFPVSFSDFFNARAAALVVNWVKQDHEHGSLNKRWRRFVTLFFSWHHRNVHCKIRSVSYFDHEGKTANGRADD